MSTETLGRKTVCCENCGAPVPNMTLDTLRVVCGLCFPRVGLRPAPTTPDLFPQDESPASSPATLPL